MCKQKCSKIFSEAGFFLIVLYNLGCLLFGGPFSKLSLKLSFLNFPIFIGEIFLLIISGLLFAAWLCDREKISRGALLWFVFALIIAIAAIVGYFKWSALALRQAALFYYSFFAGISFYFLRKGIFLVPYQYLILVLYFLRPLIEFYQYYMFTITILAAIALFFAVTEEKNKKRAALLVILFVLFIPCKELFCVSRTMLVGNIAALLFVGVAFIFTRRSKSIVRIFSVICVSGFILTVAFLIADRNQIKSMVDISALTADIKRYDLLIKQRQEQRKIASVDLAATPVDTAHKPISANVIGSANVPSRNEVKIYNPYDGDAFKEKILALVGISPERISESSPAIFSGPKQPRDLETARNNFIYRLFIWRDMFRELGEKKAVFGFGFGKPVMSVSIQILSWAKGEWERDGWMSTHNSWMNVLYRTGILGIFLILGIVYAWSKSAVFFVRRFDFTGICLCAVLLNWMVAANALPLLDVPYNAILFWPVFGAMFYRKWRLQADENIDRAQ